MCQIFDRNVGFAADTQSLVDGLEHGIAFVAHVGRINTAELAALRGESDQFVGLRVRCRSVFERSGNADRTVFHGIAHQPFHLIELLGRGLHVVVSKHHAADLRRADIASRVDAHALLFERANTGGRFASRE